MQTTLDRPSSHSNQPAQDLMVHGGRVKVQTDSVMLTVRGMFGRVTHTLGEPGIVVAMALDSAGRSLVLLRDLGIHNQGQSAWRAASYVATVILGRAAHLHPSNMHKGMRWFDVTDGSTPVEWLVTPAAGARCTTGGFDATLADRVVPPRPQVTLDALMAMPMYDDALKELAHATALAHRIC